jgi:hypothetical protein
VAAQGYGQYDVPLTEDLAFTGRMVPQPQRRAGQLAPPHRRPGGVGRVRHGKIRRDGYRKP